MSVDLFIQLGGFGTLGCCPAARAWSVEAIIRPFNVTSNYRPIDHEPACLNTHTEPKSSPTFRLPDPHARRPPNPLYLAANSLHAQAKKSMRGAGTNWRSRRRLLLVRARTSSPLKSGCGVYGFTKLGRMNWEAQVLCPGPTSTEVAGS